LTIVSLFIVIPCFILITGCAHNQTARTASVQAPELAPTKHEIQVAQEKLNGLGHNSGRPDGILGKKTFAAISQYQRANNLQVTGSLDAPTMQALGIRNVQKNAPVVANSKGEKSGFLNNVGKFYKGTGELFHDFGDRSNNGFIKKLSHFGGRIHEAIGDGITQTPEKEGISGMTKNVVKKGSEALASESER